MKILVTGVDGYIGSVLGQMLIKRGHEVIGMDSGFYREGWLYNNGTTRYPSVHSKDLRQIVPEDLGALDAVVHLAELSNDPLGALNPKLTYRINHKATTALATKCKEVGVERFVYTSSCSVYGLGCDEFKTENSEPNPQTDYAKCKVLVECDLHRLASDSFSPIILRNATAYGPSPRMRFDIVLNNLAGLAWTTNEIRLTSDGSPWRPLVHVADICQSIACTLEAPREVVHDQVFNVGSQNENYRVREIAEIVSEAFSGCRLTVGNSDGDNRSYCVSFEKIESELPGFKCSRDATAGAIELRQLFQRIDMTSETFEFRAFTRLRQLKFLLRTGQIDKELFWQSKRN